MVIVGAIVWIPVFILGERIRAKRYGFLPGALYAYPLIAAIVSFGVWLPIKREDRKVGPFPSTTVTLGDLAKAKVIYPLRYDVNDNVPVALPSRTPSNREVMLAISKQTGFDARFYHCGNGPNFLFGTAGGLIDVRDSTNAVVQK